MKIFKSIYLIFSIILITSNTAISAPSETGLLNSKHMAQFNILEKDSKLAQVAAYFQKEKIYTINNIIFEKNSIFSTQILKEIIPFEPGSKLSKSDIINMKNDISQFYYHNGYPSAIVNLSTSDLKNGTIAFKIYEGPKHKVETITSENSENY